ncbi:hypothetical protein B0H19DRAFT_1117074 [Mycena capillaripes]|nr:hypothetical protein B0H19DRAFT_1117074 [Mycena capillaripes]
MLSTLEVDRSRLAEIEIQLADLERSVSALRAEKLLVQERLDFYKYPVLTLPNEIVTEIFTQFAPNFPVYPSFIGPFSPTSLTQVCHKWREIALATPMLWKCIAFYDTGDVELPFKRQVHIAELWLTRSGCCPLTIYIIENSSMNIPEIFAAIIPHRARWEYLEVLLPRSQLPTFEGPIPLLRHIDLLLIRGQVPASITSFREAPLLRTAVLDIMMTGLNIDLPWAQLTSLTINTAQPARCVPILQHTSHLIHCELSFSVVLDDGVGPFPDITLPCLESLALKLGSESFNSLIGYLDTFILPALCSLQLPEQLLTPDPIESLRSFISKSGCKLREVHITGERSITDEAYREAFPSIPKFDGEDPDAESDSDATSDAESQ